MTRPAALLCFAAMTCGIAVGRDDAKKPTKEEAAKELAALKGTYALQKADLGGSDVTKALGETLLTIDGETYSIDRGDGKKETGKLAFDTAASPKRIDITGDKGTPYEGKTLPAIYELKGGTLTVCYGTDLKTRPTEFKSAQGSKALLIVYKLKK